MTQRPTAEAELPAEIGIISDTHGLVRPQAVAALAGVDIIVHAGDVGSSEVIETLTAVAPVVAVQGNMDVRGPSSQLPPSAALETVGGTVYVLHDLYHLDLEPAAADIRVVVTGHTHQPRQETRDGVFYLNPGSAGPRRFNKPVTVGRLRFVDGTPQAEIIHLEA